MKNSGGTVPHTGKMNKNLAAPYDFRIKEILAEAWKRVHGSKATYLKGIGLYVLILVGILAAGGIINFILVHAVGIAPNVPRYFTRIWNVITYLAILPMIIGFSYIGIRRSIDLPIASKQIFFPYHHYLRVMCTLILIVAITYAIVFAGFFTIGLTLSLYNSLHSNVPTWLGILAMMTGIIIALIVYYISLSFMFAPLLIIEKGFPIIQAMKSSFAAFNQHWIKIIAAHICILIIYVISALPLGIGVIWTLPMIFNFVGILYRIVFGVTVSA